MCDGKTKFLCEKKPVCSVHKFCEKGPMYHFYFPVLKVIFILPLSSLRAMTEMFQVINTTNVVLVVMARFQGLVVMARFQGFQKNMAEG